MHLINKNNIKKLVLEVLTRSVSDFQRVWATTKAIGSSTRGSTSTLETSQLQSQHVTAEFGVELAGGFCALFLPIDFNRQTRCQCRVSLLLCCSILCSIQETFQSKASREITIGQDCKSSLCTSKTSGALGSMASALIRKVTGFKQTV